MAKVTVGRDLGPLTPGVTSKRQTEISHSDQESRPQAPLQGCSPQRGAHLKHCSGPGHLPAQHQVMLPSRNGDKPAPQPERTVHSFWESIRDLRSPEMKGTFENVEVEAKVVSFLHPEESRGL